MSEISLVTAFFNIGRENFKAIPRTDDTYLDNFKFWSRMNNHLVVYTDSITGEKVKEIRKKYGLEEKTNIVVIDDIESIEPEILNKMLSIKSSEWFERFRILPNATSNIPRYSYLMLLKNWFLADAVERGYADGMVAWIDFGFNHGGSLYTKPEEFNYTWEYDFSDKIHLFYYQRIDEKPTYEMVRRLCDSIMGCLYVLPAHLCKTFWELTREAMNHLLAVGLYDDDQMLLLMAYRAKPDLFEMHESDWFLPLKEYGGSHLSIREKHEPPKYKSIYRSLKAKSKRFKLALRNSFITFKDLAYKD